MYLVCMFWYFREIPALHLMNILNSLKHVQHLDAYNSNQKKEKENKEKKVFSLQLFGTHQYYKTFCVSMTKI